MSYQNISVRMVQADIAVKLAIASGKKNRGS